ncbi:hypothetical protein GUITHDRAFT_109814 [Guillardia theta CCMP2712]|uniref:Uncharacterized protein n=1 Tax=Guillardia theta (strain CCMP2712) TaxID=905079 RepID=L1J8D4_GUITC|nr:hypothetical protein GUITHDRAFT_109814 [Guillardia theta CCMP2712]EKX44364.1 hypothetical protein GUITHDRAFT_109814 [Guillardia theta CCMP2712]|eukprot:XP_005831344.1 hypothetical protein GUITHDRAFT_109814 [Guillardia theta CCMP2712]
MTQVQERWRETEHPKGQKPSAGAVARGESEQGSGETRKQEVNSYEPSGQVEDKLDQLISRAQKTGIMNFVSPPNSELFYSVCPKLRTMSLHDKCLVNLHFLTGNLKFSSMTILDLSQNVIGDVDVLFLSSFPVLKKINMSKNKIHHLPDLGWENFANVQEIDVSDNILEELPEGMRELSRLRVLIASNNRIRRIPDPVARLASITDMDFEANSLEEIPLAFAANQTLKRLNVQSNRITTIAKEILEATNIERLSTRGNPMEMRLQDGVESYLQRKNLKIIENGEIISFNALEIAKERETGRALLKQKQT